MKIVLHAPTAGALARARSNLTNLLAAEPHAVIRIVANADGVTAALANPDPDADRHLSLCENTLRSRSLVAPCGQATIGSAIVELARLQEAGWSYIRA